MTHDVRAALTRAQNWHKSSHSGGENGGCVETASVPGHVGVRDTTLGAASPMLVVDSTRWTAFLAGLLPDGRGTR